MRRLLLAIVSLALIVPAAHAAGFWLPANDLLLRQDLTLLADEGVIRLPTQAWPIPADDVERAVRRVRADDLNELALQAALSRVRKALESGSDLGEWRLREVRVAAGEQGLLRDYGTLSRANGEFTLAGGASTGRWSVNLRGTLAMSPDDGRSLRPDGSDATLRLGNWLVSLNTMDRWLGPGHEGSLVLSTNARPMRQLSLDRIVTDPFRMRALRWLGPWRFSMHVGQAESDREDVRRSLFLAMRASFQPIPVLELGLTRTAQFCGSSVSAARAGCDLQQFARVLVGQDNAGFRGIDQANEPGNQMAGLDFRLVSPFPSVPLAFYGQLIGEDSSNESRSIVPNRYLGLFGAEGWWMTADGSAIRGRVEYGNTACKWYRPASQPNCAYRQAIFFAGYRYLGRSLGHTADSDSESLSLTAHLVRPEGERYSVRIRRSRLDRRGGTDDFNILTSGPSLHDSGELGWSGRLYGEQFAAQIGYERQTGSLGSNRKGPFGFVEWRRALN